LLVPGVAVVQTVDFFPPVVDDPFIFGQIAAANALSDVYAMGGTPKTVMNLAGFPDDQLPLSVLTEILRGGSDRIDLSGACLVGGHTVRDVEIKYGLSVTGIVDPEHVITNAAARPGDALFLTKRLGTGFVTTAHKRRSCPEPTLAAACESMKTLNDVGAEAMRRLGVRSATDVTGFGLAGHGNEMAAGSKVTLVIRTADLPILPGAEDLCRAGHLTRASRSNFDYVASVTRFEGMIDSTRREFLFDAQTSGGLLMAVPADRIADASAVFRELGLTFAVRIGEVVEAQPGVNLIVR
jgi:selenide,water dikinase